MTIEVIGAGVGRTGTYSLKLALEQLGFGPCYHMEEVLKDPARMIPLWNAALAGEPDWQTLFAGYGAAVDWPTAAFWRELAAAYPAAKVVLTARAAESWYQSYSQTIAKFMASANQAPPEVRPWFEMAFGVVRKSGFDDNASKDAVIATYDANLAALRSSLPPERLLVFDVKDGWPPLCTFLAQAVPATPFPRSNNREEFWELARQVTG
jgi:hypothetical protein